MKVIKTQPISPSDIVSSTIPEDRVFEWVSGASYGVATSFTSNPDDYKNLVQKSNFQDGNIGSWGSVHIGDFVSSSALVYKELRVREVRNYNLSSGFSVTSGEVFYVSFKVNSEFSELGGTFGFAPDPAYDDPVGVYFPAGVSGYYGIISGTVNATTTGLVYPTIHIPDVTGMERPLFIGVRDLRIARQSNPGTNLVTKATFDDGSVGTWNYSPATVADCLSYFDTNPAGCLITSADVEFSELGNRFSVYPGETLYYRAEFSNISTGYIGVKFFTKAGSYISTSLSSVASPASYWTNGSGSVIVPTNAAFATPVIRGSSASLYANNIYVGRYAYASNGPLVRREAVGQLFMRLISGASSAYPEADPTNWLPVGSTNESAAFDREPNTRSVGYGSLSVKLKLNGSDSIALHGVKCTGLTVSAANSANTVIYGPKTLNPYSITLTDLPTDSANNTVTVTLTGTGQVSLGLVDIGTAVDLGGTDYGATFTIVDYSRKEVDEFGTASFVKRGFAKKISAKSMFANTELNKITSTLSELRATPCSWSITDEVGLETMNIFGWYENLDINIPYPKHSYCSVNIQGLIE